MKIQNGQVVQFAWKNVKDKMEFEVMRDLEVDFKKEMEEFYDTEIRSEHSEFCSGLEFPFWFNQKFGMGTLRTCIGARHDIQIKFG